MQLSCPTADRLRDFLEGSVGDTEANQISTHVVGCPSCDRVLSSLESEQGDVLKVLREGVRTESLLQEPEFEQLRNTARFGQADTSPLWEVHEHPDTGKRLRDYRLVKKIGEGGMGTVYQAYHVHLAKHVALKILPSDKLRSKQSVARFRQEMRAVGQVNHPNVVSASDAGTIDGQHFLVMELVQGADLARIIHDRGPLNVADACEIVRQAALGLQHAHDNGLVHRDVKPSNIMLALDGSVKLLDLGLAGLNNSEFESTANVVVTDRLTSVGQIMGTLDYMAPEQITASPEVDGKADVYALGATLFRLLTGRTPCGDPSEETPERIEAVLHNPPLDIATLRNDVPAELRELLLNMLAKSPEERPQAAMDVAGELKPFASEANLVALAEECRTSLDVPSADVEVTDDVSFVVSRNKQPRDHGNSRRPFMAVALAGLFLAMVAAIIYYIQTNNGVVWVEVTDPSLKVAISDQTITMNEGNKKPLIIRAGEQSLFVRQGDSDFEFETDRFQIRRGDKIAFKVELSAGEVLVRKDGRRFSSGTMGEMSNSDGERVSRRMHDETSPLKDVHSTVDGNVAAAYFEALMTGATTKAGGLATLPYFLDGKRILRTSEELQEWHEDVLEAKGKRPVPQYTLAQVRGTLNLDPELFPPHAVFRVTITGDDEPIHILVSTGESPKVIGFTDSVGAARVLSKAPFGSKQRDELRNYFAIPERDLPDGVHRLAIGRGSPFLPIKSNPDIISDFAAFPIIGLPFGMTDLKELGHVDFCIVAMYYEDEPQNEIGVYGLCFSDRAAADKWSKKLKANTDSSPFIARDRLLFTVWKDPGASDEAVKAVLNYFRRTKPGGLADDGAQSVNPQSNAKPDVEPDAKDKPPSGPLGRFGDGSVYAVAISPDGKRVATGESREARVWDVESGKVVQRHVNRGTVHAVQFSPDGKQLAWGGFGNSFALVDLAAAKKVLEPDVENCVGFFAAFTADGKRLLTDGPGSRGHRSDRALLWDLESGSLLRRFELDGSLRCGVLTPDGEIAVTGDNRGNVIFWETLTGKRLGEVRVEAPAVLDLAINRAGATVAAVASYPVPYVSIIDVGRRVELNRIPQEEVIRAVALSGDGKLLALAGKNSGLVIHDVATGNRVQEFAGHVGGCSSLAFNADASALVSGGFRGGAALWRVMTTEE